MALHTHTIIHTILPPLLGAPSAVLNIMYVVRDNMETIRMLKDYMETSCVLAIFERSRKR